MNNYFKITKTREIAELLDEEILFPFCSIDNAEREIREISERTNNKIYSKMYCQEYVEYRTVDEFQIITTYRIELES